VTKKRKKGVLGLSICPSLQGIFLVMPCFLIEAKNSASQANTRALLYAELSHVKSRFGDACCFGASSQDVLHAGRVVVGAYPADLAEKTIVSSTRNSRKRGGGERERNTKPKEKNGISGARVSSCAQ